MLTIQSKSNIDPERGSTISLDILTQDTNLFRSQAVHEILFSQVPHQGVLDYGADQRRRLFTAQLSKAIDVLAANDLVVERRDGTGD